MWYFNAKKGLPAPVIYVEWIDVETSGDAGWQSPDAMESWVLQYPPKFHSVGFLVHDARPEYIVVAETLGDEDCSAMTKIPMGIITKLIFLVPEESVGSGS